LQKKKGELKWEKGEKKIQDKRLVYIPTSLAARCMLQCCIFKVHDSNNK